MLTALSCNYKKKTNDLIFELLSEAEKRGANEIINYRLEIGSFQMNGSGFIHAFSIAYAEAVVTENE